MATRLVFISDRLQEFYKFLRSDFSYEFGVDMFTHAEANSRFIYRTFYDLFIVDLAKPWLALPLWVKEQAQHQYFHQFVFISERPVNGYLSEILGVRIYKTIDFKTAKNELPDILKAVSRVAESHKYQVQNIFKSYEEYFEDLVGKHETINQIRSFIKLVSRARFAPCLIRGESGSGRKLCARMIHRANNLRDDTFFVKNCENLTTNELLGDLFGVAMDGVYGPQHEGLLSRYAGGTVVLENIDKLPPDVQDKLLLYLDDRIFKPLGATRPVEANTRIIALTGQNLDWFVKNRNFNPDLFFHLQAFEIHLPPLNERGKDLLLIAAYYLQYYNHFYGKNIKSFSAGAQRVLKEYAWPGNIGQLKEMLERAVMNCNSAQLGADDLPDTVKTKRAVFDEKIEILGDCSLRDIEKLHIQRVLENTSGNKSKAAAILQISRTTLREKIRQYDMDKTAKLKESPPKN